MATLENLTTAAFTVVALALALIALRAWSHARSPKILLLVAGFSVFFVKGLFFTILLFTVPEWESRAFIPGIVLDVIALLLFYAAVLKRGGA